MGGVTGADQSGNWDLPVPLNTVIQRPATKYPEVSGETMARGQASSSPGCSGLVSVLPDSRVSRSEMSGRKSRSFEPGEMAHLPSRNARETGRSEDGRR